MDRGIPTEEVLAEMRQADPPVQYLVGTPKGCLNRLERDLLGEPWQEARPGVQVKLLPKDGELYVFAQSLDRVAKERGMRRRQLKGLWARLKDLHRMSVNFLSGLTSAEVAGSRDWYNPHWHYNNEPETRSALDLMFSNHFSPEEPGIFEPLRAALLTHGDYYMHLADLRSYLQADERVTELYRAGRLGPEKHFQCRELGKILFRPHHCGICLANLARP